MKVKRKKKDLEMIAYWVQDASAVQLKTGFITLLDIYSIHLINSATMQKTKVTESRLSQ